MRGEKLTMDGGATRRLRRRAFEWMRAGRARRSGRLGRVPAVLAAAALAVGVLVVPQPALAASGLGPGYGIGTAASPHLGSFRLESGTLVWCARAGDPSPVGVLTGPGVERTNTTGSPPPGVSVADATARANYILNTWGTPSVSNVDAAAVNLAVWHFLDYANATALTGGVGIRNYYSTRAGGDTAAVRTAFDAMLAAAAPVSAASPGTVVAPAGASMRLITDPSNSYLGALVVSGVPSPGTVTLSDGVFSVGGGTPSLSGVGTGSYPLRGMPPGDTGAPYSITAQGSFSLLAGWRDTVTWYDTPGRQVTVSGGSQAVQNYTLTATDEVPRQPRFAPVLGTRVVSPYVAAGGEFADVLTFSTTIDEWPRMGDGSYALVTARGVLYGPLDAAPVESASVPAGTPIAGTATVTTSAAEGPTVTYTAAADATAAAASAFYTWVWRIDGAEQPAATQRFLDDDYVFQDRYGRLAETHLVPSVTTAAQAIGSPEGTMIDTAIIDGLLPAAGAELSFAVYRTDPIQQCTADTLVWTNADAPQRITAPGRYDSPPVVVPGFGSYSWIETLRDLDGVLVHEGACLLPNETTRVDPPIIESAAVPVVEFGGYATDVAIVNGPLPAGGETFVTFELFEAAPGVDPSDACTLDARVASTIGDPVPVRGLGRYASPGIRVERAGTYYWIETLWWLPDASTDAPIALAQSRCGQSSETTVVALPTISSHAQATALAGAEFHDTVTVTGLAAGAPAELRWSLYRHHAGAVPVCDDTTRVFASDPVAIEGSGRFLSPSTSQAVAGRYFWVATLQHTPEGGDPVVLARGACEQEIESTLVTALASTGGGWGEIPGRTVALAGGAVLSAGVSLVLFGAAIRRRRAAEA